MNLLQIAAHISEQAASTSILAVVVFVSVLLAIIFVIFQFVKRVKKEVSQRSFQKPLLNSQVKKIIEQLESEGFRPADVKESKAFVESQGIDFQQIILYRPNKDQIIPISKWKSIYFLPDAGTNKDTTTAWHIFIVKE